MFEVCVTVFVCIYTTSCFALKYVTELHSLVSIKVYETVELV